MKPLDIFRLKILIKLAETNSFQKGWAVWEPQISRLCSGKATPEKLFRLGEHLSNLFRSNRVEGRGQASVSGGGAAWECLVAWYLNLIFWGTDVIATRQNKQFVPKIVNNALTVTISNHQTNTESDIIVYRTSQEGLGTDISIDKINIAISERLHKTDVAVVQCKTNWNDNAQIPMLWDLIYNSSSFRIPHVSVGIQGVNPTSFRRFAYAFVTVPTITCPPKSNSLSVLRVRNMTGGNYWGKPTHQGIARCINEFFLHNFPDAFSGGVTHHIEENLGCSPEVLEVLLSMKVSELKRILAAATS
ncbi:MAG: hypothetical protein PHD48_01600 [Alphaproteobacteria bacterium]|nr:hypothetical protein [Alphaproteobacteria bacterium]